MSLLRRIPFLADFTEEERAVLFPLVHRISLEEGHCLFQQEEAGDGLHLLLSGEIQVVRRVEGKESIVATLSRRGDVLGEMALLGGEIRPGTATALRPTVLLELKRTDFENALQKNPALALAVARSLTQRILRVAPPRTHARTEGKVFVLMCSLPSQERLSFSLNLALAMMEQTRRRVLLVEVTEDHAEPAVSHLSRKARGIPPRMELQDFQSVEGLRAIAWKHASGMDLLSISEPSLVGPLFGGLTPLTLTARQEWDFILVSLPGRSSRSVRALWEAADRTLYVRGEHAEKGGRLWREMESAVPSSRLDLVELLHRSPLRRNRPGRYYIPWNEEIDKRVDREGFFLSFRDGPTQRGMDRMARHLGGLRIGIALGAGAALGMSSIGVLRALERNGIYPDLLAGTSMGALVGGGYAAGRSAEDCAEIVLGITRRKLWSMADFSFPWKGVLVGDGVLRFVKTVIGNTTFDQLQLPFACVATDILTGQERIFRHGAVAEAVRGSISLPFFFEPFFWQGRYLADGGLVNPVPTSVVKAMGANITIAVNNTIAPSLKGSSTRRLRKPWILNPFHGPHIFDVMAKTLYTMQYSIAKSGADEADAVIAPPLADFSAKDFLRGADIIRIGEEHAEKIMPKILAKLPFFADRGRRSLHRE